MKDIRDFHITLLRVFALILSASYKRNEIINHTAFTNFLKYYIPDKNHKEYINVFNEIVSEYESEGRLKKISSNSVKLIAYCQEINKNFLKETRIMLWLRLFELVKDIESENIEIHDYENLFAESLLIDDKIKLSLKNFVIKNEIENSKDIIKIADELLLWYNDQTTLNLLKPLSQDIYVNDREIKPYRIIELKIGMTISLSNGNQINYQDIVNKNTKNLNNNFGIELQQVSFFLKKKQIIAPINIDIKGKGLVALLGRSGSGKTSLLKLISGINKPEHGEIIFYSKNDEQIRTAYVAQHESFVPEFTVKEILKDRIKFLKTLNKSNIINYESEVQRVTQLVGLNNQLNQKAGKGNESQLSGGQLKKLSIALQLLLSPHILLVDEPLSGLSSADAIEMMQILKNLANNGCLVICSLHQPSYNLLHTCDRSLIFDENGYAIYYGQTSELANYIRIKAASADDRAVPCSECFSYNPSDLFEIIEEKRIDEFGKETNERKISPEEWNKWFNEEHNNIKSETNSLIQSETKQNSKFFNQIFYFFIRDSIRMIKRKYSSIGSFLASVLLFFLITIISKGNAEQYFYGTNINIPAAFLMMIISAIFIGTMLAGNEICGDRSFRQNEILISKTNLTWLFSKLIRMFFISIILSVLLNIITFYFLKIPLNLFKYIAFFSILIFHGAAIGLIFSTIFKRLSDVYFTVPLIIIPQLILSGLIINFDNFPNAIKNKKYTPLIADFAATRWAFEAMACDAFTNNKWEKQFYVYDYRKNQASYYLNNFLPNIAELAKHNEDKALTMLNEQIKTNYIKPVQQKNIEDVLLIYKNIFSTQYLNAIDDIQKIQDQLKKVYDLQEFKAINHNSSVAMIVNGKNIVLDWLDIENYPPIFKLPFNKFGRAHYFSPAKKLNNYFIDTFYFNSIIICIMNLFFVVLIFIIGTKKKV